MKEYREKYLEAMYKRDKRLRRLYITATRFLAGELYNRCVRKLYIGYPPCLAKKTAMNIAVYNYSIIL
jgi:hypothetical protein